MIEGDSRNESAVEDKVQAEEEDETELSRFLRSI
jgi:hypothetical protein